MCRYLCCRCKDCGRTFQTSYTNRINEPGVRESIVDMALNARGIRDTARVLGVAKNTVSSHLKKALEVQQANPCVSEPGLSVKIACCLPGPEAQADGQWSFVGNKGNPRWLRCASRRWTGWPRSTSPAFSPTTRAAIPS